MGWVWSLVDSNRIITRGLALIDRITGKSSQYFLILNEEFERNIKPMDRLKFVIGTLDGLKQDLEGNYLKNLSELIHGDIFSDYLEMAEYLLEESYKVAAAVIAGSTLEEHLRKLCDKNGIETKLKSTKGIRHKKADAMNSDLARDKVYSKLEQKNIIAWLDLRNKAAHGRNNEYDETQVDLFIKSIREFIIRNPA